MTNYILKSLVFIMWFLIISFLVIALCNAGEYKTPSWQRRAIDNYNYNQAIHNRQSTTIDNGDERTPSWQRRAIDNYNYDQTIHNRQKDDKRK